MRVYTEQEFPQSWAMLQNILGNAWGNMPTGDRAANIRKAIACCEAALRVFTEQESPQDWAYAQNNIGQAWSDLSCATTSASPRATSRPSKPA